MKRSIIHILTAGVIGLASYSCSDDFTDLTPKGSASYETFWSNEQDATEAVNSMYQYLPTTSEEDISGTSMLRTI